MKKNSSGFVLAESLIVSTFVLTILVVLFIQFNNINKNYNISFSYNTVEGLYSANNVKIYILKSGYENLKIALLSNGNQYIDITTCPNEYLSENSQCSNLVSVLNIKKVIFTAANVADLKNAMKNDIELSSNMKSFISTIGKNVNEEDYRLIIEFNDGSFSTIIVK